MVSSRGGPPPSDGLRDGEGFVAIASAAGEDAVDGEVAALQVNLEGETVFPLGAGAVDLGDAPGGVPKEREGVVFHGGVPVGGGDHALDLDDIAQKHADEVEEVYALIEEDAAAREVRVAPPGLAGIGLAVDAANPEDIAQAPAAGDAVGFLDTGVEAVVEAEGEAEVGPGGRRRECSMSSTVQPGGFSARTCFLLPGRRRLRRGVPVRRADEDGVRVRREHILEETARGPSGNGAANRSGSGSKALTMATSSRCWRGLRAETSHFAEPDDGGPYGSGAVIRGGGTSRWTWRCR